MMDKLLVDEAVLAASEEVYAERGNPSDDAWLDGSESFGPKQRSRQGSFPWSLCPNLQWEWRCTVVQRHSNTQRKHPTG